MIGCMDDLEELVLEWAEDKGIMDSGTSIGQMEKTLEEVEELNDAVHLDNRLGIKDGIGDVMVTLIIQAKMKGMTLCECLSLAYGEIISRTGEMKDGVFVKDE